MANLAAVRIIIRGRVQGVNFRTFTARYATSLGLTGRVRNLADSSVEVQAEGERNLLEQLVERLEAGPTAARVEKVETTWSAYSGKHTDFRISY